MNVNRGGTARSTLLSELRCTRKRQDIVYDILPTNLVAISDEVEQKSGQAPRRDRLGLPLVADDKIPRTVHCFNDRKPY